MKAMILAAGRGERMRPLTDTIPKPLLKIGSRALIEYHLIALQKAGIEEVVINIAHLGGQIRKFLGNGNNYKVHIQYSDEGNQALETAGGIIHALPLLDDNPFIVVNADIWTDYSFQNLPDRLNGLAHLILVNNPPHHPDGDFYLNNGRLKPAGTYKLTYSGIAVYDPLLFENIPPGKRPLLPLLLNAIQKEQISAEHYQGMWQDIGTPQRLLEINRQIQ